MGMDLLSDHGNECFKAGGWDECLRRAIEFGWAPTGTVAPMNFTGEWEGGYCSNDWQVVTDDDARALGEALLRAIAALAAREQDWVQQRRQDCTDEIEFISPAQEFAAELGCLRRLANYALKGGFVIA